MALAAARLRGACGAGAGRQRARRTACARRPAPRAHPAVPRASAAAAAAAVHDTPPSGGGLGAALGGLFARARAIGFYLWTVALAVPLFVTMLALFPFVWALDRHRRLGMHVVNDMWANASTMPWYRVEVEGRENLPAPGEPVVYVANHASYLDIYSLFALWRPFKFISKTSNFLIPIIGWSMFLTGHVPLKRMDKRSQMQCLKDCRDLLGEGVSVLFFPEGTRSDDGVMASFKKGAFSVAEKAGVPVVPVTLENTGGLMPNGREYLLRPGKVRVRVHPALSGDAQGMCDEAYKLIREDLGQA